MTEHTNIWFPCTYRLSVKGVIIRDQKLLMVMEDDDNGWDLPGGGIEHGESLAVGLAREIKEEVGLQVHSFSENPSIFHLTGSFNGKPYGLWAAFNCEVSGEITTPANVVTRWVEASEIDELTLCSHIEGLRAKIKQTAWPKD